MPTNRKEYAKAYREQNLEKVREQERQRSSTPEAKSRKSERERLRRQRLKETETPEDREERLEKQRVRRAHYRSTEEGREKERAAGRRHYAEKRRNDLTHRDYKNRWRAQRIAEDPAFNIACRLRVRLCGLLSRELRAESTFELTGCSLEQLVDHIESQFQDGMSWDNRSEWHIDHIRPCVSFDLTDPEQQRQCFHYTNLQPLWASDNCSKGAKLDWEAA
jgi:hypothetical protein